MTNDVVVKITHKEYMELCSKCKTLEAENVALKRDCRIESGRTKNRRKEGKEKWLMMLQ